jgi:sugar fermentation stimulation protein A
MADPLTIPDFVPDDPGYALPCLEPGVLVRRYKRFLADIKRPDGTCVTAHCPNSGSMRGCADPGAPVWMSRSPNPGRKLAWTWELIQMPGSLVGINTLVPNRLVAQAIADGRVPELFGYDAVRREVTVCPGARLDLALDGLRRRQCFVEIKNCTLVGDGTAMFPDAVTTRGQKHLDVLMDLVAAGHRGVLFFLVQRMDARRFAPATFIDKVYGDKLKQARDRGVEILVRDTEITLTHIRLRRPLPVIL